MSDTLELVTKNRKYRELVLRRKQCTICQGVKNPAVILNGRYDSNHINPWTKWHGNLNAKVLIIGQDWGHVDAFIRNKGQVNPLNPTNNKLIEMLALIGIRPEDTYLTNAILCMKETENLSGRTKSAWYRNCGENFLKYEIEIVNPKIIITLGVKPFRTIKRVYNIRCSNNLGDVIKFEKPIIINEAKWFPVYHIGKLAQNLRPLEKQREDWGRIKNFL
ncbi:uracil-DNA glycosylase family protein [Bacillus sp. JNUCC-21]|uniref:uracil-DNA glycosylase family protein n=1 Tax=Bacillus TaxID=1386 RepID=UPI0013D40533|nr:uracil-DNA glycosylase family protein [Bacillus velezensis]